MKPNPILPFFREHFALLAFIALLAVLVVFTGGKFAEFKYAALRLGLIVFFAFAVIAIIFKSTLRPYIFSGKFAEDFLSGLPPVHRFWATIVIIALIVLASVSSFTHAADNPAWLALEGRRWETAEIRPEKRHFVEALAAQIERNRARYERVAESSGVPWQVIAAIHNMECSQDFRQHLHNGDPLTARTRHVPRGLPAKGSPPFDWEASALDALRHDHFPSKVWWHSDAAPRAMAMDHTLLNIELYNGPGVLLYHPRFTNAYLTSWTNLYHGGKYVGDSEWDPYAQSAQCGVIPILQLICRR